MSEWKEEDLNCCINREIIKESGKLHSFEMKLITTWLNIGGLGQEGPTLRKYCARLSIQQIEVYCKDTQIHGMSPVIHLTQSITDECDDMIKQDLVDDLFFLNWTPMLYYGKSTTNE